MMDHLRKGLSKKVDDFVLIKHEADMSQIKFVNNKIVKTGTESDSSINIFAVKDNKIVSTDLKEFDKKSADLILNNISNFLKVTKQSENYFGIAEGPFKYKKVEGLFDKKIKDIDEVDITEKGINAALENAKKASGTFQSSVGKTRIITSNGVDVEEDHSSLYFSLKALVSKEASGHRTASARTLSEFNVEKESRIAGEFAKLSCGPKQGPKGKFDVILSPLSAASILGNLGDASSMFSVEAGLSFLAGKLNKNLGNFNLIDDGTLKGGMGSSSFDAEGVPTQRTEVIKDGVLKTYLHNTSTAKKHNTKTTANAGLVAPDSSNVILEGKTGNPFDIKKGIYITNTWYTRFQNYATGDFSTIPRDGIFLVENGEITKPIKNIRISDNILNMLKNIDVFAKEKEYITSWEADSPYVSSNVLIRNVNVTKPTI
jgi:PmbA protein